MINDIDWAALLLVKIKENEEEKENQKRNVRVKLKLSYNEYLRKRYTLPVCLMRNKRQIKKKSPRYPQETLKPLEMWWAANADFPYPNREEIYDLVNLSGLNYTQIYTWFNQKRYRTRNNL